MTSPALAPSALRVLQAWELVRLEQVARHIRDRGMLRAMSEEPSLASMADYRESFLALISSGYLGDGPGTGITALGRQVLAAHGGFAGTVWASDRYRDAIARLSAAGEELSHVA